MCTAWCMCSEWAVYLDNGHGVSIDSNIASGFDKSKRKTDKFVSMYSRCVRSVNVYPNKPIPFNWLRTSKIQNLLRIFCSSKWFNVCIIYLCITGGWSVVCCELSNAWFARIGGNKAVICTWISVYWLDQALSRMVEMRARMFDVATHAPNGKHLIAFSMFLVCGVEVEMRVWNDREVIHPFQNRHWPIIVELFYSGVTRNRVKSNFINHLADVAMKSSKTITIFFIENKLRCFVWP